MRRTTEILIGYKRTSDSDQVARLKAQERDLRAADCEEVFGEQVSSVSGRRTELDRALAFAREGDILGRH